MQFPFRCSPNPENAPANSASKTDAQLLGLLGGIGWADRIALGFEHGQRMPVPVTKDIIGSRSIGHHH